MHEESLVVFTIFAVIAIITKVVIQIFTTSEIEFCDFIVEESRDIMSISEYQLEQLRLLKNMTAVTIEKVEERIKEGALIDPLPKVIPYGIIPINIDTCYGVYLAKMGQWEGLSIIASVGIWDDRAWYHVSLSRQQRLPDYKDLKMAKDVWFGKDRWAMQLFPEAEKHVNTHNNCLHLWHCMDDFYLPDFRSNGEI